METLNNVVNVRTNNCAYRHSSVVTRKSMDESHRLEMCQVSVANA